MHNIPLEALKLTGVKLTSVDKGVFTRVGIVVAASSHFLEAAAFIQGNGSPVPRPYFKQDSMNIHFTRQAQDSAQNALSVPLAAHLGPHGQIEYFQFIFGMINGNEDLKAIAVK